MTKPKLLLADDSVTIRKVVELTFADEGIEVITAADADTAMQKFVESEPDIVLVDAGLSGTSGYQICEMIKQDEATEHIPVLLLVGSFEPFDQDEAGRVGADGFLTKPFKSIRELVNKVFELLRSGDPEENPDLGSVSLAPPTPEEALGDNEADGINDERHQNRDVEPRGEENYDKLDPDTERIPAVVSGSAEETEPEEEASPDLEDTIDAIEMAEDSELPDESKENADDVIAFVNESAKDGENDADEIERLYNESLVDTVEFDAVDLPDLESPAGTESENELIEAACGPLGDASLDDDLIDARRPAETDLRGPAMPAAKEFDWSLDAVVTGDEPPLKIELPTSALASSDDRNGFAESDLMPLGADDLSPEFISLVAERVIQRLSDRVIREIAQKAVPEIAEKLIREALEEDKRQ